MKLHELDTPSVLIDLDKMERNIQRMQTHCDELGLKFRPHIKSHKIPDIAKMQLEAGAIGIACQKVSEAEVFASAGLNDIQIPYNIVGPQKTGRLADLALYNRVTVSADHEEVIAGLAEAARVNEMSIRVMVDLVTEVQRTGAPVEEVVNLAKKIDADENLHFVGVLVYPSNPVIRPALQEALDLLNKAGIGVETVSGGGIAAARHAHEVPELTEIRVGTYVYNDWNTVRNGLAELDDCAMTVWATVVSRPTNDRAILDSGNKTLAADNYEGEHGCIVEYPGARIYKLNEEHGYVDLSACDERPSIGDRVRVIPVHACVVSNLHDQVYGVRRDDIEVTWPVAARGKVW